MKITKLQFKNFMGYNSLNLPKNEEIFPGIYGIGALAIGRLKSDIEASILKEAANTKGNKVFDYNYAFEIAKKLIIGSKV